MNRSIRIWLPPVCWAAFMLVLMSIPFASSEEEEQLIQFIQLDKIIHAGLFFILAFLSIRSWVRNGKIKNGRQACLIVILSCSMYGLFTELYQLFLLPYRGLEVLDIVADALGSLGGGLLGRRIFFSRARKKAPESI